MTLPLRTKRVRVETTSLLHESLGFDQKKISIIKAVAIRL
jgi:hypothetical protein